MAPSPKPTYLLLPLLLCTTLIPISIPVSAIVTYTGVAEAGLEFGLTPSGPWDPPNYPGMLGSQYFLPLNASIDHFTRGWGANTIRLPFTWERAQVNLSQPLNEKYMKLIDQVVNRTTSAYNGNSYVLLDLHNYGMYWGTMLDVPPANGKMAVTTAHLVDFWTRVAARYASNDHVMFGLMNGLQMRDLDTTMKWFGTVQQIIDAVRAMNVTNRILYQGGCYSGGQAWVNNSGTDVEFRCSDYNVRGALSMADPLNKSHVDLHQYFDADFSGSSATCIQDPVQILTPITQWMRNASITAFISEFGVSSSASCMQTLKSLLPYLDDNSDVWIGWTFWAAGPAWQNYIYEIEAYTYEDDFPQTKILGRYFSGNTVKPGGNRTLENSDSSTSSLPTTPQVLYAGVSEAGLEFGIDPNGPKFPLPGILGKQYYRPLNASLDYFTRSLGANIIRLPFAWERLQPTLFRSFDEVYQNFIDQVVERVTSDANGKSYVILDIHNYARYNGTIIGEGNVPETAYYDLVQRLAARYNTNHRVMIALMNEPHDMNTVLWWSYAQNAVNTIRDANFTGLLLVPGGCWTGALTYGIGSWCNQNNDGMVAFTDPLNNYAFDIHQYFDYDYTGTHSNCSVVPVNVLGAATTQMRKYSRKAFLSEFAGSTDQTCIDGIKQLLPWLDANSDVWIGWTWWAAGPGWGDYMYSAEATSDTTERPGTKLIKAYFPGNAVKAISRPKSSTGNGSGSGSLSSGWGRWIGIGVVVFSVVMLW